MFLRNHILYFRNVHLSRINLKRERERAIKERNGNAQNEREGSPRKISTTTQLVALALLNEVIQSARQMQLCKVARTKSSSSFSVLTCLDIFCVPWFTLENLFLPCLTSMLFILVFLKLKHLMLYQQVKYYKKSEWACYDKTRKFIPNRSLHSSADAWWFFRLKLCFHSSHTLLLNFLLNPHAIHTHSNYNQTLSFFEQDRSFQRMYNLEIYLRDQNFITGPYQDRSRTRSGFFYFNILDSELLPWHNNA